MICPSFQSVRARAVGLCFVKYYCSFAMKTVQPATRIQALNICVFRSVL
jgi:hypothetical protein